MNQDMQPRTRLLTMRVGEARVAVNVGRVREVLRATDLVPVPLVPAPVCGIVNLRGNVVTVLDFGALVGSREECSGNRIVLVRDGREEVGILVDEVYDVREIDQEDVFALDREDAGLNSAVLSGGFYHQGILYAVIDLEEIMGREIKP